MAARASLPDRRWLVAGLAVLGALLAARPAGATVRYQVSLARPGDHTFQVGMTIPNVQGSVTVQMASWDALYQIRDFAHHVTDLRASDASGAALAVERVDGQTWRIRASGEGRGEVRVQYATFWNEAGPFGTELDGEHAFLNLAMVLCYVPGRTAEDTVVRFDNLPQGWRVAVELPAATGVDRAAAAYSASSYDALADAPVEIGRFEEAQFRAGGRPIRVVWHGDSLDRGRLVATLTAIVNYETSLMGEAPFDEYTFIFHIGRRYGGGGMEHSNSTAIGVDSAATLANVSAHEFFHLWNVKRIRPQSLEPLDRTREMWTPALWFAEGVTNTYASYTLVRTGLWSKADFLDDLSDQITALETRPAHLWQSAEQSSLTTWFDKYALYNQPEFSISYYGKGQLLGVGLDLMIRDATDNRASLDDVMRKMNEQYAHRGIFYPDSAGVRTAAEEVIRQVRPDAPADLGDFFRRYVAGTEEPPFETWLGIAGLTVKVSGDRREVQELPQASERQREILAGLLHGSVSQSTLPAAAAVAAH
jgi:predicted metalloprotease with PDZ domain